MLCTLFSSHVQDFSLFIVFLIHCLLLFYSLFKAFDASENIFGFSNKSQEQVTATATTWNRSRF